MLALTAIKLNEFPRQMAAYMCGYVDCDTMYKYTFGRVNH